MRFPFAILGEQKAHIYVRSISYQLFPMAHGGGFRLFPLWEHRSTALGRLPRLTLASAVTLFATTKFMEEHDAPNFHACLLFMDDDGSGNTAAGMRIRVSSHGPPGHAL